jgi:hypothetical protein
MVYGAGKAGLLPRNRAALALIFGMHILALFAWSRQRPAPFPDVPQVVSILLRPSLPPARPQAAEPVEPGYPRPRSRSLPPAVDFFGGPPAPSPPASAATEAAAPASSAPAPSPPAIGRLEDARAPMSVEDAIREQKEAEGGFGASLSRRQAGRIDRELRKGRSGVPDEPDTPMGRFRRGLEAAHIDRSMSAHFDTYTSPDGTVYYRKRIGNMVLCRRSGNIAPLAMKGMEMGGEMAENVRCPSGADWKKD